MLISGDRVACDTETTGTNPWGGDRPFAFSFANTAGHTRYFEFPVDPFTRAVNFAAKPKTFAKLKTFFENPKVIKVFHNAPFDVRMLELSGIVVKGDIEDTELKLRICDSTRVSYELKPAALELFDIAKDDQKELAAAVSILRTRARQLGFAIAEKKGAAVDDDTDGLHGRNPNASDYWVIQHAPRILLESLRFLKSYKSGSAAQKGKMVIDALKRARAMKALCQRYAVTDAERTILLACFLDSKIEEYNLQHIYDEEMKELFPVVYRMVGRGVYLDRNAVTAGKAMAVAQSEKAEKKIEKLCAKSKSDLNPKTFPNSAPQKQRYFIDELGLDPLHYTPKNNPKIDKTFFEYYTDVPMCAAIQTKGKADKAISTYFDNYLLRMDDEGILHGSAQQIGAKTGRFSYRDPNLQNTPKRAEEGDIMLEVRRPFGPRPGHVWYMLDYKQIEARIFADEANDKFMLRSFRRGEDVYANFADVIKRETGLPISRDHTKSIFLGKLYGLGVKKLIKSIMDAMGGAEVDDVATGEVIDCFELSFPRVPEFMRETMAEAKAERCIYNRYGQRVDIRAPYFDPATGKTFDESYRGVNYKIQSSAARLMKSAMVRCDAFLTKLGYGELLLTIHDELIFEFPIDKRPRWVIQKLANIMSDNQGKFRRVTTPVDVKKTTGSWLDSVKCDFVVSI